MALLGIGRSALALCPPAHALVDGDTAPGVHHLALDVDDLARATAAAAGIPAEPGAPAEGPGGRPRVCLARAATLGVRLALTERIEPGPPPDGPAERIDHIGVEPAPTWPRTSALFAGQMGFAVESRQTDVEVALAVETFTSDRYGVVSHARPREPVGGLRVTFVAVGDCELEFLASFDPRGRARGAAAPPAPPARTRGPSRASCSQRGRGLHHVATKVPSIDAAPGAMAAARLPLIDATGRPGSPARAAPVSASCTPGRSAASSPTWSSARRRGAGRGLAPGAQSKPASGYRSVAGVARLCPEVR